MSASDAHWLAAVNEHFAAVLAPVPEEIAAALSPADVADLRERSAEAIADRLRHVDEAGLARLLRALDLTDDEGLGHA